MFGTPEDRQNVVMALATTVLAGCMFAAIGWPTQTEAFLEGMTA